MTSPAWGNGQPTQEYLSSVRAVDYIGTCSNLVRTSAWDAIGGLDEEIFPAYYVDVNLCMKLRQIGHTVLCNPASQLRHYQGASTNRRFQVFIDGLNRAYFIGKWSAELAAHEPYAPADPLAVARANERTGRQAEDLAKRYTPQPALPPSHHEAEKQEHAHFLREIELLRKYGKELEAGESRLSNQLDAVQADLESALQMLEATRIQHESSKAEIVALTATLSKTKKDVTTQKQKMGELKAHHQKLGRDLKLAKRSLWRKWWDRFRRRWSRGPQ